MKLLLGLLTPTGGEICIGGVPLRSLGLSNYRHMLGAVMQDDTLFAGSISDNISFFDPMIDMQRVYECAELAAIAPDCNYAHGFQYLNWGYWHWSVRRTKTTDSIGTRVV